MSVVRRQERHRAAWRRPGLILAMIMILTLGLAGGCREEPWPPEAAVLVNGRPIDKAAVDRVLEWGFTADLGRPGDREATIPLVLERLIDEQLILAEAEKIGLTVGAEELERAQSDLGSAWFGTAPPPAERGELRDALRNQLILRKMTQKVMAERRVLSVADWRDFWAGWPKNRPGRYLVKVLLLPPMERPPALPAKSGRRNLEKLADAFEREGLAAIVSGPLWLGGDQLEPAARLALEEGRAQRRLAGPIRLAESWAVYEVLEIEPGPSPAEEFRAARTAFEEMAGEKAFQKWLANLRAEADIKINPALNGRS